MVENIKDIQQQFNKVLQYSQGFSQELHTDGLFKEWAKNKADFIRAFGDKLIYESNRPLTFELDDQEKKIRVNDFILLLDSKYDNIGLVQFLEANKSNFYTNLTNEDYSLEDGTVIKAGTKIIRSFKYFEKSPRLLEELQNQASEIIQEDKVEGYLCFSVHPLDFLSISDNANKWRSCHSLSGEYRSGNLSLMTDRSTFICYLKSKQGNVKIRNFPEDIQWNSKKWRVLLHMSEDNNFLFASKQYPFSVDRIMQETKVMLAAVFNNSNFQFNHWERKIITEYSTADGRRHASYQSRYIDISGFIIPMSEKLIGAHPKARNYQDLLYSSSYRPQYLFGTPWEFDPENIKLNIGDEAHCVHCGEVLEDSESFLCHDCELKYGQVDDERIVICECCGDRFFAEDGIESEENGNWVCPSCMSSQMTVCENCFTYIFNENIHYDRETEQYYCQECYDNLLEHRKMKGSMVYGSEGY